MFCPSGHVPKGPSPGLSPPGAPNPSRDERCYTISLRPMENQLDRTEQSLLMGGNEVFKMPRVAVYRSMIMNHMIHHRAQLGVYLRLNDVAVPSMYGPTADEGGM